MNSWVLMYHRVCEETPQTRPWFLRGTAVTPDTFKSHLDWVLARYAIVPLADIISSSAVRPSVALTFDDGYEDLVEVADWCVKRGVLGTCFATCDAVEGQPLWFDLWYALTAEGLSTQGQAFIARYRGVPCEDKDWVGGPVKRWLAQLPHQERISVLGELHALHPDVHSPRYLNLSGLKTLAAAGWTVGGHGQHHTRLSDVSDNERNAEIRASRVLIDTLCVPRPLLFAYPDGAHNDFVCRDIHHAGFSLACTVEKGPVHSNTDPLKIPRLFCRSPTSIPHPLMA